MGIKIERCAVLLAVALIIGGSKACREDYCVACKAQVGTLTPGTTTPTTTPTGTLTGTPTGTISASATPYGYDNDDAYRNSYCYANGYINCDAYPDNYRYSHPND